MLLVLTPLSGSLPVGDAGARGAFVAIPELDSSATTTRTSSSPGRPLTTDASARSRVWRAGCRQSGALVLVDILRSAPARRLALQFASTDLVWGSTSASSSSSPGGCAPQARSTEDFAAIRSQSRPRRRRRGSDPVFAGSLSPRSSYADTHAVVIRALPPRPTRRVTARRSRPSPRTSHRNLRLANGDRHSVAS